MSIHIGAKTGEISEKVLLPGDPLRAKYIAETFLEQAKCYNKIRGMLGFTGFYKNKRISIQSTGMGIPSAHIYIAELLRDYGCKDLIRIGTFGSIASDVKCNDVVLVNGASTDSDVNRKRFGNIYYAPTPSFELLYSAWQEAQKLDIDVKVAGILTGDIFYKDGDRYEDSIESMNFYSGYGIKGSDMETVELYTMAAKYGCRALSILTCSDELLTGKETTAAERETSFNNMVKLALDVVTGQEIAE